MSFLPDSAYKIEQLSVFLENRAGRLAEIIHLLGQAQLNIRALSLADTSDFGILRLLASDNHVAEKLLKEHGFTTGRTHVVAVEMADIPGSLDHLLGLLSARGINVEYMYAFARRTLGRAIMIFRFDMIDAAIELLRGEGSAILPAADLAAL